jgi:hypothetical protein
MSAPQIRRVPRFAAFAALALALALPARAAEPLPPLFNTVEIRPTTSSLYIATVTMTMPPFVRRAAIFSSTYSARVFPYFFWSESGRIWIVVPEGKLLRVARGEAVDFSGHGVNSSGDERRIEGHATPTGPAGGVIRVRVFLSKRLYLTFDTTYALTGTAGPGAAVTPR